MLLKRAKRRLSDDFGVTFGVTFVLTMLIFPVLVIGAASEFTGRVLVAAVLVGFVTGIWMLMKAVLLAAVTFYPSFALAQRLLPAKLAFVVCAVMSSFLSAAGCFVLRVGLWPPSVAYSASDVGLGLLTGVVACVVAGVVSSVQMGSLGAER